ncbi:MAG: 50S ribosomal protein L31 [Wigglesworthia glossinidia]|nr:50S ribosomal protein L31 [Wigglesworthia glossinidia]
MKKKIHPKCTEVKVKCACGNSFKIISTLLNSIRLDVCNACHPFYTGKQRIVDTGGRVSKFNTRFDKIVSIK